MPPTEDDSPPLASSPDVEATTLPDAALFLNTQHVEGATGKQQIELLC